MKSLFFCSTLVVVISFGHNSQAFTEQGSGSSSSLPQSGVLSQTMRSGYRSGTVDLPWGERSGTGLQGQPPVTGSVSKLSDREWRAMLFNNSDDTYSVDVRVVQKNAAGSTVKSDSFSYTLKAKQSAQRSVTSTANVTDASLELVRWRNLTPKKEAPAGGQGETGAEGGSEAAK